MRGVRAVVVNGLKCLALDRLISNRPPRVWVAIESWKITARYFDPDAMAFQEYIARDAGVDGQLINLTGMCQFSLLQGLAIAQPQDTVRQVARFSIWENVYQLGGEIRIRR